MCWTQRSYEGRTEWKRDRDFSKTNPVFCLYQGLCIVCEIMQSITGHRSSLQTDTHYPISRCALDLRSYWHVVVTLWNIHGVISRQDRQFPTIPFSCCNSFMSWLRVHCLPGAAFWGDQWIAVGRGRQESCNLLLESLF